MESKLDSLSHTTEPPLPKGFKICHCSEDLSCNEKMEVDTFIYKYESDGASLMVLAYK